jgi:RNA polymerase sigma-70 factor (ECF subfamily)
MQLRKSNPEERGVELENIPNHFVENEGDVHHISDVDQNIQLLDKGLLELSQDQQLCIKLFYLEEKTYAEISVSTGYSLNQVKSYIQNGKRNLYNFITANNAH